MFFNMKDSEIRSLCRDRIESLEHWLRRLIDDILTPTYGDYFDYQDDKGNRLLSSKLAQQVEERRQREPSRYPRKIDAVLLEDAVNIVCNRNLFKEHFRKALENAFPEGCEEARTFLTRLLIPRNNLAHANAISLRQAEQIICYSNDVIDSLKKYYSKLGMQQEYNVPLILKVTDSFGNVFTRSQFNQNAGRYISMILDHNPALHLRPDDTFTIEIEVDPSFDPKSYTIRWITEPDGKIHPSTPKVVIPITNRHVGQSFCVVCKIITKNEWHRLGGDHDDYMMLSYKVLPPIL